MKRYLKKRGIPPAVIMAKGLGEEHPVGPNETPEGRQRNRRVEINIVGEESNNPKQALARIANKSIPDIREFQAKE